MHQQLPRWQKWISYIAIVNLEVMVKLLYLSLFALLLLNTKCSFSQESTQLKIEAVEVRQNLSFFGETFYRIYRVRDHVVFQHQYQFDSSSSEIQMIGSTDDSVVYKDTTYLSEIRNRYFVFHKDSSYGFDYDPHRADVSGQRLRVDSLMTKGIKGRNNFQDLLKTKPVSTTWNSDKTELKEVFICNDNPDTPIVHISLHYSSKLNHLKESLNEIVDSIKNMKLFKCEFLVNEFYSKASNQLSPAFKIDEKLMSYTVTDPQTIITYLNKYKESIGSHKAVLRVR
jgi:hypothetical protein